MDGEHIEMMIHGWASSELREKAIIELGHMREELYILRQLAKGEKPIQKRKPGWKTLSEVLGGLTKRAPDVANVTAISVSCPRCGLTFSEPLGANDFCSCEVPDFAPFIECQNCGKPPRR
jgi:hypothetical protein